MFRTVSGCLKVLIVPADMAELVNTSHCSHLIFKIISQIYKLLLRENISKKVLQVFIKKPYFLSVPLVSK